MRALRSPVRGAREVQSYQLQAEALQLQERAAGSKSPRDLHAAGVALMLVGDFDESVSLLQSASQAEPRNPQYKSDLGAAQMTRFLNRGSDADATAALATFDEALSLSPSLVAAVLVVAVLVVAVVSLVLALPVLSFEPSLPVGEPSLAGEPPPHADVMLQMSQT